MLSIGEFSKICRVSTKTLRYYAEIGLLCPDKINPENGYRYYSIEQLKEMLFIDRLKNYGFSLEEIRAAAQSGEDREERLCLALRHKKKQIQEQISSMENILGQLDYDIENLYQGKTVMSYLDAIQVNLVEYPALYVLSTRRMMTMENCAEGYGQFFEELFRKAAQQKLTPSGLPLTVYHSTEYSPLGYDIEFALPVKEYATGTKDFIPGLCLKTVLRGDYSGLTSIYAKQHQWAETENYESAGPPFDIYVADPGQVRQIGELVTEVYCPVRKK